jgi:propanol-preferring alcohol dehydrogenase
VSVPSARHLVPLGGLDPVQAAPLADAALTAYHAVRRVLPDLYPGSTTLLVGAGGLGQYGVQLLRALSPTRVVVVDTDPAKREQALRLGAHEAFHPDEVSATLRGTAAASLDFVGTTPSLRLAVDALDRRGTLVIVGLGGGALPVGFLSQAPEASVTTSYWGTHQDLVEVVALAGAGRIGGTVHERDLAAVGTAMTDLRAGHVDGRIVLVP